MMLARFGCRFGDIAMVHRQHGDNIKISALGDEVFDSRHNDSATPYHSPTVFYDLGRDITDRSQSQIAATP